MSKLTLLERSEVYGRVEHFVNLVNEIFNTDLEIPHVRFDKRGSSGGEANYELHEINLNAGLMHDNWDRYMNQTIPHEVAHLAKVHIYGAERRGKRHSPHGYYWQKIMRALGVEPSRCHNMDTSKTAQHQTKHLYTCSCCHKEVIVSAKNHNKLSLKGCTGQHVGCPNSRLTYSRTIGKVSWVEAKKIATNPMNIPEVLAEEPKKEKVASEPKPGTKIAHAMLIYREMIHHITNRQDIISVMSHSMQITRHQAAGYYQQCKKRLG